MKRFWFYWLLFMMPATVFGNWQKVYADIADVYLYDVSVADLAVAALKGIKQVDRNLTLANDGTRLSLYYKGKVIKVIGKPKDNQNAEAWGQLTDEMIKAAIEKSPKAGSRDFEISELLAAEMVKILDKDSKFYTDIDEANGVSRYTHKRQFAARMEGAVLYLKIGAFNKQTFREVKQSLSDYADAEALVIDLRGCPGGMAGEAVKIADLFLDGGIIASVKGRDADTETYYNAEDGDVFGAKPIFVLIDEASASAAEILAGALQEQGRAKVIGTLSKGKGTMQKLIGLSSGGVLAITGGYFLLPSSKKLNGVGVVPDICTFEMPETKNIENLLKEQSGKCQAERREDTQLELSVVDVLLKKNLPFQPNF